ncbi:MAG: hypothetical protein JO199_10965 [Candidatus Eremiobacteraeota bacterium]|nr:hypothetical protein [Candidatus Eremiobacteraeota bacterium]
MLTVSAALAAAMMRDVQLQGCVRDAGIAPAAYISKSFKLRDFTLRSGEHMTLAIATEFCMERGQSTRVFVYLKTPHGYRQVLDDFTFSDEVEPDPGGTITLPTHETIDTILESTLAYNGDTYAFSPWQSHIWDVPLEMRRPFLQPVTFDPGASSTILAGSAASNFGQTYSFTARAGQHVTLAFEPGTGRHTGMALNFGDTEVAVVRDGSWSGTLPKTGEYWLDVTGDDRSKADKLEPYRVRLSIR